MTIWETKMIILTEECYKCGSGMILCITGDCCIVWECPNCEYWFTCEAL